MSDEEREALRNFKSEYETCDHYSSDLIIELDDAEILLNLIENQQKEIERLEARKYMLNAETGEISQIPIDNNYISKDKIKELLENETIDISGFRCIAVEDIEEFLEEK